MARSEHSASCLQDPVAETCVAVVTDPHAELSRLLEITLDRSNFWPALRARALECELEAGELRIAIKPDLDAFDASSHTGTDPALVEELIVQLRAHGFQSVVVCDGRNRPDSWLHNRGPLCVPDLIGYHFEAPSGQPYTVVSASDDAVPLHRTAFDQDPSLVVCAAWVQADFRITIGKSKTDDSEGFALCVHNLLGLIAPRSIAQRWPAQDRCLLLMRHAAPHFALLDGLWSSHGSCGSRVSAPLRTATLIASSSAVLVDWLAAVKMGADPHVSPISDAVLKECGLPANWRIVGDASPWADWTNPNALLLESVRRRGSWEALDTLIQALLQPVDRARFPFADLVIDEINSRIVARLNGIADERLRSGIEILLQQVLAFLASAYRAYTFTAAKNAVVRAHAPFTLDLAAIDARLGETAALVDGYSQSLLGAPTTPRGYRLRTIDQNIHFAASTTLPIAFDDFVERVEIGRSIQYMNDYLGGETLILARDELGRPTAQVERNLYLPQPNWTSLLGGEVIDVEKVETLEYGADHHTIAWRTLRSPNGSASADDGRVTFARDGDGAVRVHVFARQRFGLPALVAAAHIERMPALRANLVADAYDTFFTGTVANLRAAFAGSEFRIGREPKLGDAQQGEVRGAMIEALAAAGALLAKVVGGSPGSADAANAANRSSVSATEGVTDDLGFRHFAGVPGARVVSARATARVAGEDVLTPRVFLVELGQAIARDLASMTALQQQGQPA